MAGGTGTRLRPATLVTNKHLIPIINKPMILYPIETLKEIGVTDILIVSGGDHIGGFAEFLGDGSDYGISLTYRVQKGAGGIAAALLQAESFSGGEDMVVILGDNIFGEAPQSIQSTHTPGKARIFIKYVEDPERFGVFVETQPGSKTLGTIVEKPKTHMSNLAVTGLYVYPSDVFDVIRTLKPSSRGELEITDVNNHYLSKGECEVYALSSSIFWSDAGTPDSLVRAIDWAHGNNKY